MKRKQILTTIFLINIIPMFFYQYGANDGVTSDFTGLMNIMGPLGMMATLFYFIGVFELFKNKKWNASCSCIGTLCMIASEIYYWNTWSWPANDRIYSLENVFPMFYIGLVCSVIMFVICLIVEVKSMKTVQ